MFGGNCQEALKTYEEAFDAKIAAIQKYSDMPPNPNFRVSEEQRNLVLHSSINILGSDFMCADSNSGCSAGSNMYVSVSADEAAVRKAWDILKQDGKVYMELQPAFFAKLHGSLQDRFGINWMFSVGIQDA